MKSLNFIFCDYLFYRIQGEGYIHYKAMLISVVLQVLLLMFEVLVCDKLENNRHWWILVFVPLIFISILSVVVCIWAAKHDRSFEVILCHTYFIFYLSHVLATYIILLYSIYFLTNRICMLYGLILRLYGCCCFRKHGAINALSQGFSVFMWQKAKIFR